MNLNTKMKKKENYIVSKNTRQFKKVQIYESLFKVNECGCAVITALPQTWRDGRLPLADQLSFLCCLYAPASKCITLFKYIFYWFLHYGESSFLFGFSLSPLIERDWLPWIRF